MLSNVFFCLFFLSCDLLHISFTEGAATVEKTIVVDQRGQGDFKTIQDAIKSIPDGNKQWIKINVASGVYREKVAIPSTKPYILLQGNGVSSTVIDWSDHSTRSWVPRNGSIAAFPLASTFSSATFTVLAENFVARDITFKNSYNINNQPHAQAIAALVGGDKNAFYGCAFLGYQDTLCDYQGRHYFSSCWIEGAVDFIFGFGQSIYVKSNLNSIIRGPQPGWLTAHAKLSATTEGGFVFKYCTVNSTGKSYLGRAWNQYATVVFYSSVMADIVVPSGWDPWNSHGHERDMTFAESNCTGPGANTGPRVPWEMKLNPKQLEHFVSNRFIDKEGWLGQQP